jgi:hypothetical protein
MHCCSEQVEQAMEAAVEEDEEIDEDEYFMRKFLLEQVSLSLTSADSSQPDQLADGATLAKADASEARSADNVAAVLPLERTASQGSSNLGSPIARSAKPSSKTPPKPRLKTPRKRRARLTLETHGPTTTARMVAIESYKDHVKGNIMIRAKAYVSNLPSSFSANNPNVAHLVAMCGCWATGSSSTGVCSRVAGTEASGKVEDKLTSGRENRLKSRGLSSALGRARAGGKKGKETAEDRASEFSAIDDQASNSPCIFFILH